MAVSRSLLRSRELGIHHQRRHHQSHRPAHQYYGGRTSPTQCHLRPPHMPLQSRLVPHTRRTASTGHPGGPCWLERVMVPSPRPQTVAETTSATDTARPSRTVRGSGATVTATPSRRGVTVTCRKCKEEYDTDEERRGRVYLPSRYVAIIPIWVSTHNLNLTVGELELDETASVWEDWDESPVSKSKKMPPRSSDQPSPPDPTLQRLLLDAVANILAERRCHPANEGQILLCTTL